MSSYRASLDLAQLFFGLGDEFGFIKNSTHPEILTFLQSSEYLELPFINEDKKATNDVVDKILSSTQTVFLISGHPGSGKRAHCPPMEWGLPRRRACGPGWCGPAGGC